MASLITLSNETGVKVALKGGKKNKFVDGRSERERAGSIVLRSEAVFSLNPRRYRVGSLEEMRAATSAHRILSTVEI